MTREHNRIRILQKGGTDEGRPQPAEPMEGPQPETRASLTRHVHARERMLGADCDIIFTQSLYRQITDHVSSNTSIEQGGLLLGYVEQHPDQPRPFVVVDWALEAKHTVADVTRLTFTHETWAEFERQTDELRERGVKRQRVGWYHSHPGHGIFLSNYDLNVCEDFRRPTQVALVVDPVSHDGGFFVRGEAGFRSDTPQGFWEWHDLSDDSVVHWRSMSAKRAEGEIAPLLQPPDSAAGRVAPVVKAATGAHHAEPEIRSAQGESAKVTPLFDSPDTTHVEPSRRAPAEQRKWKTVSEVPLWAAALTAAVLLGGIVTLGVSISKMKQELKSKTEKGDLDSVKAQVADLKKEFDLARTTAQPRSPEPARTEPAAPADSVMADEPRAEDSAEPEPGRKRGADNIPAPGNRTENRTRRRDSNQNSRTESAKSNRNGRAPDAANSAPPAANVKTQKSSAASGPTPPSTAPVPAKSPAPPNQEQ